MPESIFLSGANVKVAGRSGNFLCREEFVDEDDLLDLVCLIETAEFMLEDGVDTVELTGETFSGIAIRGEDSITILPD